MRVCFFVANPITFDGRVLRHAQTLRDAGHEVTVLGVIGPTDRAAPLPDWITFRTWRLDRRKLGLLPRLTWAATALRQRGAQRAFDALFTRLPPDTLARVPLLAELGIATSAPELLVRALRERFDIYHANDLNTLPAALWAARLTGRRFVYDAHELYCEEEADLGDAEVRRRFLVEGQARAAAAVITVSELLASEMQALHGWAQPPLVIRNLPPLVPIPDPQTRPLGEPGSLRLLYQGANVGLSQLGTDDALRALARLKNNPRVSLSYTIRGRLTPSEEVGLRRRIEELGLADRVRICPPVSGAKALVEAAVAEGHDVGLAPHLAMAKSWILSTGSKLYEYQNAGMAVVASDLLGNRVAAGEAGVYYPPGDDAALAEVLVALAHDRTRLRRLQVLGRRRAERELCWDRERSRLIDLYERLAAARG